MNAKDWYAVLGVPRDASPRGIRRAFRELARRHHPDLADGAAAEGAAAFHDVVDAYRVLSDPEKRRAHDAWLRARERSAPGAAPPRPERVRPAARPAARAAPRASAEPRPVAPAEGLRVSGARPFTAPLCCDVTLSPAEARRGGTLPIRVPITTPCRTCRGLGRLGPYACARCGGHGNERAEAVLRLRIPAGVRAGSVFETRGLRVRIDVDPSAGEP